MRQKLSTKLNKILKGTKHKLEINVLLFYLKILKTSKTVHFKYCGLQQLQFKFK